MSVAANDLARLLDQPEESIELDRAAFLMACGEYPQLDVEAQIARLDRLAAEAEPAVRSQPDPAGRVAALRQFLAGACGFRGNEADYYDPANSFLHLVLDRRAGIPITLSVLYMEVGRRLGVSLLGVGLPGHFMVKYQDEQGVFLLDPFHGGRSLTPRDCREIVESIHDGRMPFEEQHLAAVDKKYIVLRMLKNLRGIYLERGQHAKALGVLDMVLAVSPASVEDLKQRGRLHCHLQNYAQARRDLESYLFLSPQAADADDVRQTLQGLNNVSAMLN